MLWDDNCFYIAAELEEPHVWATLTNHDSVIFHDPDFEVFIDPDGDRHNYYEFEMNALNATWDLLLKKPYIDGGPAVNEWEISGLQSAAQINGTLNQPSNRDQGWTVEIAFPWKALAEFSKQAAPPKEGDVWRVDFSRVEWQIDTSDKTYRKVTGVKEDNWVWSPMGIVDMHRPEQWGYVEFTTMRGKNRFRPEPDLSKEALLDFYYSQKEFKARKGRWARDAAGLSSTLGPGPDLKTPPVEVRSTPSGFDAFVPARSSKSPEQRWHIREDGLLQLGQ
jgi:hypothetical protein